MNILLVGDYPPPFGGIAVHVQQLQRHFLQQGHEVRVLDIGKGGQPAEGVICARSRAAFIRQLAAFAARKYRVHVHTSGNNPKSWMVAAAVSASRWVGAPAPVITLHSGLLPGFLAESPRRRAAARFALKGYGRIVAVSSQIRDALVAAGVPAESIRVYPPFLSSQMVPGQAPGKLDWVIDRRSPLLAMAHHPSPVYGRALMFEALRKISRRYPDAGLAVFGPGTQSPEFWEEARIHRVEGLIEDFGELPHPQALAVLQRSQLFIRPTQADGDALSVREALALGVPCVASDVCDRPAGVRTFRAGDADDLVERACEALAEGPKAFQSPDAGTFLISLYQELERTGLGEPSSAAVQA